MLKSKRVTAMALAVTVALPATAVAAPKQDLRSADARDAARAAQTQPQRSAQDLRMPDSYDAAERSVQPTPTVRLVRIHPDAFDWGDAGIGAAGGLAILALAGGMGALATHRRRVSRVPATTS